MALTLEQINHIKEMINPKRRMFYDDRENFNRGILDFLKGFFKEEKAEEANQIAGQLFDILKKQKDTDQDTNNTHLDLLNIAQTLAAPARKLEIIQYRYPETKDNPTLEKALDYLYKPNPNEGKAQHILMALESDNNNAKVAKIAKVLNFLLFGKNVKPRIEFDEVFNTLMNAYDTIKDPVMQRQLISLLNNFNPANFEPLRLLREPTQREWITQKIIEQGRAREVVGKPSLLSDWLKTPTNFFAGYKFYTQRAISGNTSSYQKLLAAAGHDEKPQYKNSR